MLRRLAVGLLLVTFAVPRPLLAQTAPSTAPAAAGMRLETDIPSELQGRTVEDIRVLGNTQVATAVITNVIRTREGAPYDPETVREDYQRIFGLRKFSNVEAKVEPTETGVIVVFVVTEQRQINSIAYRGNANIDTLDVKNVVDLEVGQAIDRFRIAVARQAIEEFYQDRNYPYAHVTVPEDELAKGALVFNIVEGPNVRIRKVDFVGNNSFTDDRLKGQVQSKSWIWIFRPGTFDPDTVDDDVAALRRYYQDKGFFDVRVGRKLVVSPDQREMMIQFLIEEGPRYIIEKISFEGNQKVSEAELRAKLKLVEGRPYDADGLQRDVRQIVRSYSPYGFIYQPQSEDPDYLRIDTKPVFRKEPGKVELVYQIREGKPFKIGRILVKGNTRTQDKVVLREMRVAPGQLYNSGEIQDAADRLRTTPYFQQVDITPIGTDPTERDVLVEVAEARTASFNIGAGVSSNGGIGGNITYEQRNFDISNWPTSAGDIFSDRAFIGAGQTFRISLEPGTEATNASVRFSEPWIFDQPYSFTTEAYLRQRQREDYEENRLGGRVSFGKRFNYVYSALLTLRGEDVEIEDIEDEFERAQEILDAEGHTTLTSVGLQLRRDTTGPGFLPAEGTITTVGWESFGLLGGQAQFQKISASWSLYQTVYEDLLDRRTVLSYHLDAGYIYNNAPFFERFYGGGIGSVRGFEFRGISPRSGPVDDRVGGDFSITGTIELNFPLVGETLRGVVFTDAGTVEEEFEIDTIRWSAGAGIRLVLPFLGQAPLALDFAVPINRDDEDDTQLISFSFGFAP